MTMRTLFLLAIGVLLSSCGEKNLPTLKGLLLNREAVKDIKESNVYRGKERIIEGLSLDPYLAENHLNLGLTQELSQDPDNAMLSYSKAEELSQDPILKFISYFNRAQALAKLKKIDEALELYQKALEIVPNSKEVKINIELLIQQQQGGGGSGDDQKNDQKDNKDQKQDQKNKDGKGKDNQDKKDDKDDNQNNKDKDKDKNSDKPKDYKQSQKYKPREFKGDNLQESDVKKILGEIKQQEQKIRAQYFKSDVKEKPHEKDW